MNTTTKPIDLKIPDKMKEDMARFNTFWAYQTDLVKRITDREPGITSSPFEHVDPDIYVMFPLQIIPLEKIENLPPSASVTKEGLEHFKEEGIEPQEGAFHGIRLGRHVDVPIAVTKNDDGTFTVIDGIHRTAQAVISGDTSILAFVEDGSGPTLRDVYHFLKDKKN